MRLGLLAPVLLLSAAASAFAKTWEFREAKMRRPLANVDPSRKAVLAGLQQGDIIISVDQASTATMPDLDLILLSHLKGRPILMKVQSDDQTFPIAVDDDVYGTLRQELTTRRMDMAKITSLAVGLMLLAMTFPASAQDYYIAVNNKTGRCQVTMKQPNGTKVTQVGGDTYSSKKDAIAAMKVACTK